MSRPWPWVVVLLAIGCDQRRSEPFVGPIAFNEQQTRGEVSFFRHCNECHPQGESGLGPSLNEKPLPEFLIKNQVRNPIAIMPPFSDEVLPPEELDDLVEYLKAIRRADDED